jgi:hypothetical protein
MLGNHADHFFNTPMRTTVVKGGNTAHGYRNTMPAPFEGGSRTTPVVMSGLADDGTDSPATADPGDVFSQIANAATRVQQAAAPAPAPAKPNYLLWGGIAVAVAVAFGAFKSKRA